MLQMMLSPAAVVGAIENHPKKQKNQPGVKHKFTSPTSTNSPSPSPVNIDDHPFTQSGNPTTNEVRESARALIRTRQQDINTSNSLDNAIASSESENNDTPDVEEVDVDMPDLNNNDNDDNTPTNTRTASGAMSISVPEDTAQGIVDVVTTARKNDGKKKKAKAIPIKKGARCYVLRKRLKYAVMVDNPA